MNSEDSTMIPIDEVMSKELYTLEEDNSVYAARMLMTQKEIRHVSTLR